MQDQGDTPRTAPPEDATPSDAGLGLQTDASPHLEQAAQHLGLDQRLDAGPRFSTASVNLPKGGGALRSIAEAFQANPATGSGAMSIPLALPSARGLAPTLALSYDSGSGNGPYGHGWSLSLGQIARKTDKGVPRYHDGDTFVMSDAEDMVPALEEDAGAWVPVERTDAGYTIVRYRPRVEGAFSRIERWTEDATGDTHWRVRDRSNVLRTYGRTAASRVADPDDDRRVFRWLLDEVLDERGNRIVVTYTIDDRDVGVSNALHDHARAQGLSPFVEAYPSRISYGNATPHTLGDSANDFLFQVVFDWGLLDDRTGNTGSTGTWTPPINSDVTETSSTLAARTRHDAFSSRRAGFEIHTRFLCRRIVLFHAMDTTTTRPTLVPTGSGGTWWPVSSWHLRFDDVDLDPGELSHLTKLLGVTRVGWRTYRESSVDITDAEAMPEVAFAYVEAALGTETETLAADDAHPVPPVVDGERWRFVDLDGEGLPGLLSQKGGGWSYKRNDGDPAPRGDGTAAWFGTPVTLPELPGVRLGDDAALSDVDGDGRLELVVAGGPHPGTWTRRPERADEVPSWGPFRAFEALPAVDRRAEAVRMVDLTGDGRADLLQLHNRRLTWHPSRALAGYARHEQMVMDDTADGAARAPQLLYGSATEATYMVDMTGDGLPDIVCVRATDVCYWPNLGYGRFGAQVRMAGAPTAETDAFDTSRVRFVDVDGSGTSDLVYLGAEGVTLARNLSGNGFSAPEFVTALPATTRLDLVDVVDVLGDGTACLVWSAPRPGHETRFVRLMKHGKPHLLTGVDHGTGAVVHLQYTPSTRLYVEARAAGRPWATRLPFPVQCLTRVETVDHLREHRLVTRYGYGHGYYDGVERSFRGFGRVDQWDTETVTGDDDVPVEPVRTTSWFHTGAWIEGRRLEEALAEEWWTGDDDAPSVGEGVFEQAQAFAPPNERDAARALRGRLLRQEVWRASTDPSAEGAAPYVVQQHSYATRALQPGVAAVAPDARVWARDEDRPGVFLTFEREVLTLVYDETDDDPRMTHRLVLEANEHGTPVDVVAIAYPRTADDFDWDTPQETALIVRTQLGLADDVSTDDRHRLDVPWFSRQTEVVGLTAPTGIWTQDLLTTALSTTSTLGPEGIALGAATRVVGLQVQRYADPDTGAALALGEVDGDVLLVYDVRSLVMTTALLDNTTYLTRGSGLLTAAGWGSTARDDALTDECGYVLGSAWATWTGIPSGWTPGSSAVWATSGTATYDDAAFYQPDTQTDPFGTATTIGWDASHALWVTDVTTSVDIGGTSYDHEVSVEVDAHTLQPVVLTDVNGSDAEVAFDPLGRVVKAVTLGQDGETIDTLAAPTVAFTYAFAAFDGGADPLASPPEGDDEAPWLSGTPASVYTKTRREHGPNTPVGAHTHDETWTYLDGLGRPILTKARVATSGSEAFVGSGRVLLDAKGQPVKQYEPYFTSSSDWEDDATAATQGVTAVLTYDPLGRLARIDHPDGTYETIDRTPWREVHADREDTIPAGGTDHVWYEARAAGDEVWAPTDLGLGTTVREDALEASADQSLDHRDTPTLVHLDPLGRPFLEERVMSTPTTAGAYDDATGTQVDLDVLGRPVRIGFRYIPDGETATAFQLATEDVLDLMGQSVRHVRRDAQTYDTGGGTFSGGTTHQLAAVDGAPVRVWDSRDQAFRRSYDDLRRPLGVFVAAGGGSEVLHQFTRYGEDAPDAADHRLIGQVWKVYDAAGLVTTVDVDVNGRVVESTRHLVERYYPPPDWTAHHDEIHDSGGTATDPDWIQDAAGSSDEVFTQTATFDVAGRPIEDAIWRDASKKLKRRYTYDAGGRLTGVEANLPTAPSTWVPVVQDVDYNARGQRTVVKAGKENSGTNPGLVTTYTYDPLTFRLLRMKTVGTDGAAATLQDIRWVHDAAGRVVHQEQAHSDTVWFANTTVTPHRAYVYDALGRLTEALGREHTSTVGAYAGGAGQVHAPYGSGPVAHKADGTALQNYKQVFSYDAVGNITELSHAVNGTPTFVRTYAYDDVASGARANNQLTGSQVGSNSYPLTYDAHGNTTSMSHLEAIGYDAFDRMQGVKITAGGYGLQPDPSEPPAYDWAYVYDAGGQRVRKVHTVLKTVSYDVDDDGNDETFSVADGVARQKERIYVGPYEIWRTYTSGSTQMERETLHLMDGDRRVAMVETLTWDAGAAVSSPTDRWRYQLDDHLGTSVGEVTGSGEEIGWEEYHPYGTTAVWSVDATRGVSGKRYRYTGMERDDETGLGYHSQRYYCPWLGRWTRPDPIGVRGGVNLWVYASGSPIGLSDSSGLDPYLRVDDGADPTRQAPEGHRTRVLTGATDEDIRGRVPWFGPGSSEERDRTTESAARELRKAGGAPHEPMTYEEIDALDPKRESVSSAPELSGVPVIRDVQAVTKGVPVTPGDEERTARDATDLTDAWISTVDGIGVATGAIKTTAGVSNRAIQSGDAAAAAGASKGATLFHGTDVDSALHFLNRGALDAGAAAAGKIDGPAGFFMATVKDDAIFFAARRQGTVLEVNLSADAVTALRGKGMFVQPIPAGKSSRFVGSEFVVPTDAFDAFNDLLQAGEITFRPGL